MKTFFFFFLVFTWIRGKKVFGLHLNSFGEKKCSISGEDLFFGLHFICSPEKSLGRGSSPQCWKQGKIAKYPPQCSTKICTTAFHNVLLGFAGLMLQWKRVVLTVKSIICARPFPFSLICFVLIFEDCLRLLKFKPVLLFLFTNKWLKLFNSQQSKKRDNRNVYCRAIPTNYIIDCNGLNYTWYNYDVTLGTKLMKWCHSSWMNFSVTNGACNSIRFVTAQKSVIRKTKSFE